MHEFMLYASQNLERGSAKTQHRMLVRAIEKGYKDKAQIGVGRTARVRNADLI